MNKRSQCQCEGWMEELEDVVQRSRRVLPVEVVALIEESKQLEHPDGQLIAVLYKIQDCIGYLSEEAIEAVAHLMHIPTAVITGVASFYHCFRLKPCGKYVISICLGTACYVKGAQMVLDRFSELLGIQDGETTEDGLFTLEVSRCLGTCALAPVVKIGDKMYASVEVKTVALILKEYQALGQKSQ